MIIEIQLTYINDVVRIRLIDKFHPNIISPPKRQAWGESDMVDLVVIGF